MNAFRPLALLIPALGLLAAAPADAPDLKQAEAEADRLDPGWRLADLQAKRPKINPAQDGAARVVEVYGLMTPEWRDLGRTDRGPDTPAGAFDALTKLLADDPTKPVPPQVVAALKAQQTKAGSLLTKARALEKVTTGRYEVTFGRNGLDLLVPQVQDARAVVRLLQFDALARAAAGDIDGALGSARAILGVARSIGDEPVGISQLVRMAIGNVVAVTIPQVLARGQATEPALAATQTALAAEAVQPFLLHACRGERAITFDVIDKIVSGQIDVAEVGGEFAGLPRSGGKPNPNFRGDQAVALHLLNRAVEIAKKPWPDQPALWDAWDKTVESADPAERKRHAVAYLTTARLGLNAQSYLRSRAMLRAAETMVALERIRRAKGHWPRPGESLAPTFKELPTDPFTGKAMLWKPTATGLVVYSAGYDRADNGGKLDNKNIKTPGTDIGFLLADVNRRPRSVRAR